MKKLFFAVALTLGSFMFINAQEQPQDDSQNVVTEEVTEVKEQAEATEVEEVKEDVKTVTEEESNVAE